MKLLVVSPRFPWPADTGDKLTVLKFLEFLAPRHEITLISGPAGPDADAGRARIRSVVHKSVEVAVPQWRRVGASLAGAMAGRPLQTGLFDGSPMREAIHREMRATSFDLVYGHTIRVGESLRSIRGVPRVLNLPLSWGLNYRRMLERQRDWFTLGVYGPEYLLVRRYEAALLDDFELSVVISKADQTFIERVRGRPASVMVNPHGVDHRAFVPGDPSTRASNRLVLSGNMGFQPNVDAARFLVEDILPLVRRDVPDVEVQLVGARPHPVVEAMRNIPGVTVTGRVPSVTPYLQQASIAVDPLRIGAGLQNKVIEAMACATPVVATTMANEGIGAPADCIICRDDAPSFAEAVTTLLRDPVRQRAMGANARAFVEREFTWEYFFSRLEHEFVRLAGRTQGAA